jgi:HSP20 family protein
LLAEGVAPAAKNTTEPRHAAMNFEEEVAMTNLSVRQNRRSVPTRAYAWDPFDSFRSLWSLDPLRGLDRPLGRAFETGRPQVAFAPSFDILEREDSFVLKADLPGVRDEDLEVSVMGNQLTVSGSRRAEERKEGENYTLYERSYGDFSRIFTLPNQVSTEEIEAKLEHGELTIVVPKRAEAKPRKIPLGERLKGKLGKA